MLSKVGEGLISKRAYNGDVFCISGQVGLNTCGGYNQNFYSMSPLLDCLALLD